jgi:hypothetical protein
LSVKTAATSGKIHHQHVVRNNFVMIIGAMEDSDLLYGSIKLARDHNTLFLSAPGTHKWPLLPKLFKPATNKIKMNILGALVPALLGKNIIIPNKELQRT